MPTRWLSKSYLNKLLSTFPKLGWKPLMPSHQAQKMPFWSCADFWEMRIMFYQFVVFCAGWTHATSRADYKPLFASITFCETNNLILFNVTYKDDRYSSVTFRDLTVCVKINNRVFRSIFFNAIHCKILNYEVNTFFFNFCLEDTKACLHISEIAIWWGIYTWYFLETHGLYFSFHKSPLSVRTNLHTNVIGMLLFNAVNTMLLK